ncbi:hypothetical protein [Catellatospora sichuanensis]|uniref:hypothetical protein n=1 Tax=Catellatospora sichuanensis TaxID=1969805 RepID=UPI0011826A8A|nr:hypothetical protein [Catellatospora sichuanensis]
MTPAIRYEVLSASALRASADPTPARNADPDVGTIKAQDRTAKVAREYGDRPDSAVGRTRRTRSAAAPARATAA